MRCGICYACRLVESTKKIVLAHSAPAGPGIDQSTADLWNKVLADNPCLARVHEQYEVKVWVIPRPPTELDKEENVRKFIASMRNEGWSFDGSRVNSFNIHLTFRKPN